MRRISVFKTIPTSYLQTQMDTLIMDHLSTRLRMEEPTIIYLVEKGNLPLFLKN